MSHEIERQRIPEQVVACRGGRGPLGELAGRAKALATTLHGAGVAPEGPFMARPAGPITEVFLEEPAESWRSADYLTEVRCPFAR